MKLFTKISFILSLVLVLNSCASKRKAVAAKHIKAIKNTAILVRLQTYQSRIDYFNSIGDANKAAIFQKEVWFRNKELMRAFKEEFDFCSVYFFYSYDAKKIKKGEFSGVFLDETLKVDESKELSEKENFYVVGFDGAEIDTEFNLTNAKLVVMDHNFKSLKAPFPYYHGYYYTRLPRQAFVLISDVEYQSKGTDEAKAVYLLNKSFYRYYKKVDS